MFSKKKINPTSFSLSQEEFGTRIGRHAEIHGRLKMSESVRIDGKILGNIEGPDDSAICIVIGPEGEVVGDVVASRIILAGKVSGNIHAFHRVEIMASAVVEGDIKYASIAVEHGARLLGLMIQVNASDIPARSEQDAHKAIRKAQKEV